MRSVISIFLFLLFANQSVAQQYNFRNYSLEQGLSRSGVFDILEDHSGFLWIATEGGGVCKFDGNVFHPYTRMNGLASENVRVIFEDDRNVLWMGTEDGLSYFDGKNFQSITVEDGLSDNFIRAITQDYEGNIWVGTNTGISIIDPDEKGISGKLKFNLALPHKRVRALLAQDSVVWIGTDGGLCKYENNKIEVLTTEDGLSNNRILYLFVDNENSLWVGSESGLNHFTSGGIQSWHESDGLLNDRVRTISQDVKGNIWLGTTHGISIYNGNQFINITGKNGLSNERIRCLMMDDFDNMWIGTYFGGIMRFNYEDFVAFTAEEGLSSNQISCITTDRQGDILVGTYSGASFLKFSNGHLISSRQLTIGPTERSNIINDILIDFNGNYWFGTPNGIVIIDSSEQIIMSIERSFIFDNVTALYGEKNKIWIGTDIGLIVVTVSDDYVDYDITYLDVSDGLAGMYVSTIEADKNGLIWVTFADGTISIFEDETMINPVVPENFKEVLSISFDEEGTVWLGTNGNGIYFGRYLEDEKQLDLQQISISSNLTSNYIFSLLAYDGKIWAGHEKGIDLINQIDDSTFAIRSFGPERGFYGLQNNPNASYVDEKGNVWFGTLNGLFELNTHEIKGIFDGHASVCYIKKIDVNGISVYWPDSEWCSGTEGAFNLPKNLVLPYNKNNISFDFVGLNFISPEKVKYSWMLKGFETSWNAPNSKNYVSYTNLEPGEYSFLLKSSDEYGIIKGEPISFTFQVDKPFWDTWLFRIIAAFIVAIIIMLIMRLRTNQLRRNQKNLEAVIEQRTQEIRTQNKELELKQKEIESSNLKLQEKNEEITDSIHYSKRIQRSILPSREKASAILGSHFIFYRPKDIVSGDFYWVEHAPNNPDKCLFAVADCTGHGVPGAMVSLIGTRALNASLMLPQITKCSEVLDKTNEIVISAFTDFDSGEIIKDGMDITLCSLDYSNAKEVHFQYAGAQNPVWIIRRESLGNLIINGSEIEPNIHAGGYNLFEIKADKQPIGYFEGAHSFTNYEGILHKGDRIYLFSDGFADQFGGDRGKKFKYKSLKELMLKHQNLEIIEQYDAVRDAFYNWKQDIEQIDDVCLMGVEV